MTGFEDIWYTSGDGLRLYARDYPCRDGERHAAEPILCMHGLTRNSADFAELAEHLAARYRVIAVDQRGRGRSAYDPVSANYQPLTYVGDMFTLLDALAIPRVILVGTSMGGLMSLLMAAAQPQRVSAMVINDIGPEIDPRGLARIKAYVGKSAPVTSWTEAVAQCRANYQDAFPDFSERQWLDFTRGLYHEENGIPVPSYDPAISAPLADEDSAAVPPDLWPVFDSVSNIPMLVVRGASSDILAPDCVRQMQARKRDLQVAEIPHRGHAPTLTEPAAIAALDSFLSAL